MKTKLRFGCVNTYGAPESKRLCVDHEINNCRKYNAVIRKNTNYEVQTELTKYYR